MQQDAGVRDALKMFYEAFASGDASRVAELIAADAVMIGTDPDEWWTDRDAMMRVWEAQRDATGGELSIRGGDPVAFSDGDVGWAADRPILALPDGSELPFRFTVVFRRENGRWKMVQSHSSIGVPNEDAIGQELPVD
jgi:ketosteroid isomerase-like protein